MLVFCVQTDRKQVRTTIAQLAEAIAANDVNKVLTFVDEDAYDTMEKAKSHMGTATIEWAKVRDFRVVNINYFTPEPLAIVSFRGSVGGKAKGLDVPFTVVVQFTEVELIKNADGKWRVTDNCRFSYPGYRN
ncbi:MAG: hypothetical protein Q4G68_00985 [Planctomycetia bacterium]|nr:hypothetical protein [Planctomycetia bacterium]